MFSSVRFIFILVFFFIYSVVPFGFLLWHFPWRGQCKYLMNVLHCLILIWLRFLLRIPCCYFCYHYYLYCYFCCCLFVDNKNVNWKSTLCYFNCLSNVVAYLVDFFKEFNVLAEELGKLILKDMFCYRYLIFNLILVSF